jgi:hypothetical protein
LISNIDKRQVEPDHAKLVISHFLVRQETGRFETIETGRFVDGLIHQCEKMTGHGIVFALMI